MNFIQKCERNEEDKKMPVDAQSFEEHSRSVSCYVLASIFFIFVLLSNWELAEGRTRSSSSLNVGFCAHFCCFFVVVVEWN